MEKEGLSRGIEFLSANSLNINTLITDRHNQISKVVSKKHPSIKHRYDIWHVSKGMLYAYRIFIQILYYEYILLQE